MQQDKLRSDVQIDLSTLQWRQGEWEMERHAQRPQREAVATFLRGWECNQSNQARPGLKQVAGQKLKQEGLLGC